MGKQRRSWTLFAFRSGTYASTSTEFPVNDLGDDLLYRDVVVTGRIPNPAMPDSMMKLNFTRRQRMENGVLGVENYPLMNDY